MPQIIVKLRTWLGDALRQLVRIDDTPHRKAAGLALGVFLGTFPGVGPIAALTLAFLFRVNRATALAGSLLTNTWISLAILAPAVQVGSRIFRLDEQRVMDALRQLMADFSFRKLFDIPTGAVLGAIVSGFLIISLVVGFFVYVFSILIFMRLKKA